jgi:hypothetical protein
VIIPLKQAVSRELLIVLVIIVQLLTNNTFYSGETALIDSTLVYRFANDQFPEFMDKLKKYG